MTFALSTPLWGLPALPASAQSSNPDGRRPASDSAALIMKYGDVDSLCCGLSGDDPRSRAACHQRGEVADQLAALGFCHGREGEYAYQMRWHVCQADSNRPASQPAAQTVERKSLRQERNEAEQAEIVLMERKAYCAAYFAIRGDAAEVLELQTGMPKDEARTFLFTLDEHARYLSTQQANMELQLRCLAQGDACHRAMVAAVQRGLSQGQSNSNKPSVPTVKSWHQECRKAWPGLNAEVKKPEPPKPTPKPKRSVGDSFEDVLKDLSSPQKVHTPEQQPKPAQQVARQTPAAPNLAAVATASEIEGVRSKIRRCWNSQGARRDGANFIVTLIVQMNQDGTPAKAELKDTGRYNNDPTFRAVADAAHRATMNPLCQPWPLSPERFHAWRTITLHFDSREF